MTTTNSHIQSKYWSRKPVAPLGIKIHGVREIQTDTEFQTQIKSISPKLPDGYKWVYIDVSNVESMHKQCDFLNLHYRRGANSQFTVRLTPEFLEWEMMGRGWFVSVHDKSNQIVGTVGYMFKNVMVFTKQYVVCEPIYLCCDNTYHKTGLVVKLLDELARASSKLGVIKGIGCTTKVVGNPIATVRQYSRPLNYKKLRACDFIDAEDINDDDLHESLRILLNPNKRYVVAELTKENIDRVYELFNLHMLTFSVHPIFTIGEIASLLFNTKFVKTLLVHNSDGKIVDFISYNFYDLYHHDANYTELKPEQIIKAANILMYTSLESRPDLLLINVVKQISKDKNDVVYVNDMMNISNALLSKIKHGGDETDDEEVNAVFDMQFLKTGIKHHIIGYNFGCESIRQNMLYWMMV
jgi:hypothetical protein